MFIDFWYPALTVTELRAGCIECPDPAWRSDSDGVREERHRTACAIPSPGRCEGGGWVLDPVPLVAPGATA